MSGMNVMSCNCVPAEDGNCACDITEIFLSCGRIRLIVLPELPEKGVKQTTYFIGNNESGYTEYVWTGDGFTKMGTATASLIDRMTVDILGLGRISTADALTLALGGAIGMNAEGQLIARKATLNDFGTVRLSNSQTLTTAIGGDDLNLIGGAIGANENGQLVGQSATRERYGMVRLGSTYQPSNDGEFVVGIGTSSNSGKKGQLCFNLAKLQPLPDGSGFTDETGCLRYRKKPGTSGNTLQYEMYVLTGSFSQLGVVKLLSSLTGYTEEQIEACRTTHAASVGLVLDGLDSFCAKFFTDNRMQGYFDAWALDKDLAQQIWDDGAKRDALFENVVDIVLTDADFKSMLDTTSRDWLTEKITDNYIETLFLGNILTKTKEISDAHWDDDLEATIQATAQEEVKKQLPDAMAEFIANPDNVEVVAESVKEKVQEAVSAGANKEALTYAKNVFDSKQTIELDGQETTFGAYFSAKIGDSVKAIQASLDAQIATLSRRINAVSPRAFVLSWNGTEYAYSSYNPATETLISEANGLVQNTSYPNTIMLPPGTYQVRLSAMPVAPALRYRNTGYKVEMTSGDGDKIATCSYQWYGDTGKGNDEHTASYSVGIGRVTVDGEFSFTITPRLQHTWFIPPAYVLVEFI